MDLETKKLIMKVILLILPIILVIGSIGNLFSFIIFSRKKFRKTFFSVYFRVLAFTDTFTLLFIPSLFSRFYLGQDLKQTSSFMCKMFDYFLYWVPPISGWILVVVSLDRMLSVTKLRSFFFIKKLNIQIAIVCFLFLFNSLYYLPLPLYEVYQEIIEENTTNMTEPVVTYACVELDQVIVSYWMDLFNAAIIPFMFMVLFTSLTVKRLINSRSKVKLDSKNFNNEQLNRLKPRDVRFALVSIILNFLFFMFNLPVCTYYLIANYTILEEVDSRLFYILTLPAYYLNFSVVFYVNLLTNPLFRKELFFLLHIGKKSRISLGRNTVNTL